MTDREIIAGLDVGSSVIRLVVGQRDENPDRPLHIIGVSQVSAEGINRGVISSIEDAVSSISGCLEKAERMIGSTIESVWVGISGTHITAQESRGVIAIGRSDGEISEDDISRAIEAARTVATPPNYEILHVIPRSFIVDGQVGIKDPVGMTGVRLEVDTQIIQGLSSQIKNLTKTVYRAGLDISDLVLSILATAEAVLTNRQKELGVAVIDIGGSTTKLIVFEEGDVIHTAILPIGSDHITSDIAIGLRVSIDTAEKIKLEYGCASVDGIGRRDEIDIGELEGGESNFISKKYVAEIIQARVEEIFDKIDNELKKIDRSGKLPAGIVLAGGGAKLSGLVELAKKKLRLPATLAKPLGITSAIDKVNDLDFCTAVGLVLWGNQLEGLKPGGTLGRILNKLPSFKFLTNQARKWLKKIIP